MTTTRSVKPPTKPGEDLEVWESGIAGPIALRRLDTRGEFAATEIVHSGRKVHISTEERKMNQELCASPELDAFSNGGLRPVHLIDSAADAKEIAANPNLMTEDDMRQLLQAHPKTLVEQLGRIKNAVTLQRLLAIANDEDSSIKRVQAIEARINQVNSGGLLSEVSREPAIPSLAGPRRPRASSPR